MVQYDRSKDIPFPQVRGKERDVYFTMFRFLWAFYSFAAFTMDGFGSATPSTSFFHRSSSG
jgi:hypothetical protein